jgi:hypothetical protein
MTSSKNSIASESPLNVAEWYRKMASPVQTAECVGRGDFRWTSGKGLAKDLFAGQLTPLERNSSINGPQRLVALTPFL